MGTGIAYGYPDAASNVVQPQDARVVERARRARVRGAEPRQLRPWRQRHRDRFTSHVPACQYTNKDLFSPLHHLIKVNV